MIPLLHGIYASKRGGIPTDYIAYYTFDNITGTTLFDESANSNDATLNGSPSIASGYINNAIFPDGTNDYVAMPATLLHRSTVAISTWVYAGSGEQVWIATTADTAVGEQFAGFDFNLSGSQKFRFLHVTGPSSTYVVQTNSTFSLSTWHHVVIQSEPGDSIPEIWVNGTSQALTVDSGTYNDSFFNAPTSKDNSLIGALIRSTSLYGQGGTDEFYVYDRKLTSAEISALYAQT